VAAYLGVHEGADSGSSSGGSREEEVMEFVSFWCTSICRYHLFLIGTRMRNSLMAAIYRKCLRLSNSSMQQESTGKVVTVSYPVPACPPVCWHALKQGMASTELL
jgi:hypothetical protein